MRILSKNQRPLYLREETNLVGAEKNQIDFLMIFKLTP